MSEGTEIREPRRIQLKRTKGWKMPPNTVKVDRSTRWGNPFKIGTEYTRDNAAPGGGQSCNTVENAEHAAQLYRRFTARETRIQIAAWKELRGKNLACWCPLDQPCHADVLLELANQGEAE